MTGDAMGDKINTTRPLVGATHPMSLALFHARKAECPRHGTVEAYTVTGHSQGVEWARHDLCPKCYVEWIVANVTAVTPLTGDTK